MRIASITVADVPPVKRFEVKGLSDLVVIAGPNGVGKTRLVSSLLAHLRNPGKQQVSFEIEATDDTERSAWGKTLLNTTNADDAKKMHGMLQQNRSRRNYKNSVLYYESNRAIQNVNPLTFQWEFADPYEEQIGWDLSFGGLAGRWQDTQHSIFKKIQSQKMAIANRAIQLRSEGHDSMNLEFTDPLDPFRDAFARLLGPKELHSADVQNQRLMYSESGELREVSSLSSGEREVLTIAFDFLLRKPSHCVVFFDEPELHLHPELLGRLVSTLRAAGEQNQFVFISHSPDIVSSSLQDSVIFLTPPKHDGGNQVVMLSADANSTEALHRLGHSVGIVSLGKKIVLIEGAESSLDTRTYNHLLKNRFPSLVLQASGGKGNLRSFATVATDVLDKSLWGVKFYMLADRDAAPGGAQAHGRMRVLKRYHLENYFLDAEVLARCFSGMEPTDSWLCQPEKIELCLREIAGSLLGHAVSLVEAKRFRDAVGNVDVMPGGVHSMTREELASAFQASSESELQRVNKSLVADQIATSVKNTHDKLSQLLSAPGMDWKDEFPGKPILARFANRAKVPEGRLKNLYLTQSAAMDDKPFDEIVEIFRTFAED